MVSVVHLGGGAQNGFGPETAAWVGVEAPAGTTPVTVDFGSVSIDHGRFTPLGMIASTLNGAVPLDTAGNPLVLVVTFAPGRLDLVQQYSPGLDTALAFPPIRDPVVSLAWLVAPASTPAFKLIFTNTPPLAPQLKTKSMQATGSTSDVMITAVDLDNAQFGLPLGNPTGKDPVANWIGNAGPIALTGGLPVNLELTDTGQTVSYNVTTTPFRLLHPTLSIAGLQSASTSTEGFTLSIYGTNINSVVSYYWQAALAAPGSAKDPYSQILVLPTMDFSAQVTLSLAATGTASGLSTGNIRFAGGIFFS